MASAAFCDTGMLFFFWGGGGGRSMFCANAMGCACRLPRSIFSNRVCDLRPRRSVSLMCNRCKMKVNPCRDRACRRALAVAPCECVLVPANPLRRLCVSKRSRCGVVRMCLELGEPSAEISRVEALLLSRRANAPCECVLVTAPAAKSQLVTGSALPQLRLDSRKFTCKEEVPSCNSA